MSLAPETAEFLTRFFHGTKHQVELRALRLDVSQGPILTERAFTRDFKQIDKFIKGHTSEDNIYFGVATREGHRGTKEHCREIPALWVDVDFKDTAEAEAEQKLADFKLLPSVIVASGGGLHVYWLLKNPLSAQDPRLEPVLRGLAQTLGADRAAAEKARVLRLPGTLNHKYAPPPKVELWTSEWERRYLFEDFLPFADSQPNHAASAPAAADGKIPEGQRNVHLAFLAGTMRRPGMSQGAIIAALLTENAERCEPPLPEREVRAIARSIARKAPAAASAGRPASIGDSAAASTLPAEIRTATITLHPGESPKAVDEAEEILVALAEPLKIFQRAGEIVRIITLESPKHSGGLRREAGAVQLAPVGAMALTEVFDRRITWEKVRANKDGGFETARIDCPGKIAVAYLSRLGSWHLPVLTGVISAPIMSPDGTVLYRAGYDPVTGLFLTEDWPELSGSPSREEALKALDVMLAPYSEFPFVADEDRSVFAAGILTAIQRRLLASAPLFGFKAPTQRTGKTLLAECLAITATGRPAPAMAVSGDREEIRKAVAASLREGHPIVNLDNIEHPLGSPDLSRAITGPEYADRLLGETRILRLPTNLLWTATGNNLAFRGDLAVRTLLCRLDSRVERPEERQFKITDLRGYVTEHRRELVIAALTILRAYVVAGSPDQRLLPWGGFDEWSATVRAPLVWLGMADPCATRQHVIEDDPDREQAAALLSAWHSVFGCEAVSIADVIKREASSPELTSSLLAVAASKDNANRIDPRRVSWWCRAWRDRVVDGLSLVRWKDYGKSATWRVMQPPDCGISGISGIKNPPTKTEEEGEEGEKAPGNGDFDFYRGESNPTNPINPKNGKVTI